MESDLRKTYRGTTLLNILAACFLALFLAFLMVENMSVIQNLLLKIGGYVPFFSLLALTKYYSFSVTALSILIFVLVFSILQKRHTHYIKTIVDAMEKISKGDLDGKVPVEGEDELAYLAAALNAMEDDIKTLIAKERETEKSKNELITNLAHDLRTPLTSILGYLDILNSGKQLSDDVKKEYIEIAYKKARHLQNLIEELFGFTKLGYGKLAVHMEEVDIIKLLEQVVDEFYPVFEASDMEPEFRSNIRSLKLQADGTLLARLFDNLINNAVKYGKEGKVLIVTVDYHEPVVAVSVKNYGYIIPPDQIPYLFNKFYRVEQSRSLNTGGTGLGLAIAKNIAELHGGSISCRSSEDGTVFEVLLRTDFDIHKEQFMEQAKKLGDSYEYVETKNK